MGFFHVNSILQFKLLFLWHLFSEYIINSKGFMSKDSCSSERVDKTQLYIAIESDGYFSAILSCALVSHTFTWCLCVWKSGHWVSHKLAQPVINQSSWNSGHNCVLFISKIIFWPTAFGANICDYGFNIPTCYFLWPAGPNASFFGGANIDSKFFTNRYMDSSIAMVLGISKKGSN